MVSVVVRGWCVRRLMVELKLPPNTGWDILYRSRIDSQNRGWHWWCGVDLEHRAVNSLGDGQRGGDLRRHQRQYTDSDRLTLRRHLYSEPDRLILAASQQSTAGRIPGLVARCELGG